MKCRSNKDSDRLLERLHAAPSCLSCCDRTATQLRIFLFWCINGNWNASFVYDIKKALPGRLIMDIFNTSVVTQGIIVHIIKLFFFLSTCTSSSLLSHNTTGTHRPVKQYNLVLVQVHIRSPTMWTANNILCIKRWHWHDQYTGESISTQQAYLESKIGYLS